MSSSQQHLQLCFLWLCNQNNFALLGNSSQQVLSIALCLSLHFLLSIIISSSLTLLFSYRHSQFSCKSFFSFSYCQLNDIVIFYFIIIIIKFFFCDVHLFKFFLYQILYNLNLSETILKKKKSHITTPFVLFLKCGHFMKYIGSTMKP